MAITYQQLIKDALYEICAYGTPDAANIPAADTSLAARSLNRILNEMSARKAFAYNVAFPVFTIPLGTNPILIGPGLTAPNFTTGTAPRPTKIVSASLILSGTPSVELPMNIRDDAWWADQRVKTLTSTVPTDLYYSPDYPNGSIYLWPVATVGYGIRIETWVELGEIPKLFNGLPDLTQTLVAPQAYENLLFLRLAQSLCNAFGRPIPADFPERIRDANKAVQGLNLGSPRTTSWDYGTRGKAPSGFNWATGLPAE